MCLPAEAEKKTIITFPKSGKQLIREEGDILNPQRYDKESLAGLKKSMGSLQYSGQMQQRPAPADGNIFKKAGLQHYYNQAPHCNMIIQSWDMAFKNSDGSAKVAGYVMGRSGPKGDMVHLAVGALNGFYIVKSVQHDADSGKMTMQVEKADTTAKKKTETKKKTYKVGDVVNFHGGKHYISSYPGAKGYNVSAGRAKITIANGSGKAHPWHLVYENWSETHVYGWVDDGSFD